MADVDESNFSWEGFNLLSKDTKEAVVKFARLVCRDMEIHGFSFAITLLIDAGIPLDEVLKLATILSYKVLNTSVLLEEDQRFGVDILVDFPHSTIRRNFFDSGDCYTTSSKMYLDDIDTIAKDKIASYLSKIVFVGNQRMLLKLKAFLAQMAEEENRSQQSMLLKINVHAKKITRDVDQKTLFSQFRTVNRRNKRLDYIVAIARSNKPIAASVLSSTTHQSTSGEITAINKKLKQDLLLIEDVIKNDGATGYEINRDHYSVAFSG
jgi:hypothetical protein